MHKPDVMSSGWESTIKVWEGMIYIFRINIYT